MRQPPAISERTVARRTVLEWLGQGTVLALGAELIAACAAAGAAVDGRVEGGPRDGEQAGGFPFQPGAGTQPIFEAWGERTVDPQSLTKILAGWRLRVDGLVAQPLTLTFAELAALPRQDQTTDFHCVEGWSVLDVPWNGVRLSALLDRVKPSSTATHVTLHGLGGTYKESLPIAVLREPRTLLGYGVAGSTLPLAHGFPARLVVPRLLGYKNAKYLERLELTDHELEGYWVVRGYSYAGEVPQGRLRPGKY